MKSIYLKFYSKGNFGDDLFVFILCERYKNIYFVTRVDKEFASYYKTLKNLKCRTNSFCVRFIRKLFGGLLKKDCVYLADIQNCGAKIHIGGSIFMEPLYVNTDYYNELKHLQEEKLPQFIIGSNFGPFSSEKYFDLRKKQFEGCTDICFRDKYSYNLFCDLNNVRYAPDIAFSIIQSIKMKLPARKKIISVSVISERYYYKFNESKMILSVVNIVKEYVKKGYVVRFLSLCSAEGDLQIIKKIMYNLDSLAKNRCEVIEYNGDVFEIINSIAESEYVIGARFHSIIVSLEVETPVFPLIYSEKTANVLHDIHFDGNSTYLGELCHLPFEYIDKNRQMKTWSKYQDYAYEAEKHFQVLDYFIDRKIMGGGD